MSAPAPTGFTKVGEAEWTCDGCGGSAGNTEAEIRAHRCADRVDVPAAPAPDAELERLLGAMQSACYDHAKGYDHGFPMDCEACRNWLQTIHAHVEQLCQRREAAARGEVVGTGEVVCRYAHLNTVEVRLDGVLPPDQDSPLRVALTRRAE